MQADDPHNLNRFLMAQASTWPAALAELRAGQKRSHWMWFVFPQIAGLGHSAMARTYAIASLVEARAYLAHPLLGARYREGVAALMTHAGRSAAAIMGDVDAMKLRSSLTLFAAAGEESADAALARFFDGPDPATTDRIG
ncbi:DUF1810 domain-containing protein [Sphingomonas sp.]|uniref:DUF1810 domain-containing protein n=1 Tax=Sphingomonas sp. TaxID=28214 RepID=UPI002C0783E3|nr:DUF1810 domain-containing protein [Sphingomonas sp.]HTG39864.1 DUF1810 domain-containing protein [Sphingomonas sp.]